MLNNQVSYTLDFNEKTKNPENDISNLSKSKASTTLNSPVTSSLEFNIFLNNIVKNCYDLEDSHIPCTNLEENKERKRILISQFLQNNWKEDYKHKRETIYRYFCNTSGYEVNSNYSKANVNILTRSCLPINMKSNNLNIIPQNDQIGKSNLNSSINKIKNYNFYKVIPN